jgi:hypothetical protein
MFSIVSATVLIRYVVILIKYLFAGKCEKSKQDQLRQFVLDQLMWLIQSEDGKDVLAALLALDERQQQPFEPLILASRALQDRAVLYQILLPAFAKERRSRELRKCALVRASVRASLEARSPNGQRSVKA